MAERCAAMTPVRASLAIPFHDRAPQRPERDTRPAVKPASLHQALAAGLPGPAPQSLLLISASA